MLTDYDLDSCDEIESLFGLSMTENPLPFILHWWEDRGSADESFHRESRFDTFEEAEAALQALELDLGCHSIVAWWKGGNRGSLDDIPF